MLVLAFFLLPDDFQAFLNQFFVLLSHIFLRLRRRPRRQSLSAMALSKVGAACCPAYSTSRLDFLVGH